MDTQTSHRHLAQSKGEMLIPLIRVAATIGLLSHPVLWASSSLPYPST